MSNRLQWAVAILVVVLIGGYFVYAGGDGPCSHISDLTHRDCMKPAAKRG
jgi:hypothetical protein